MTEHPVSYLDRANQKRLLNQMLFFFFFTFCFDPFLCTKIWFMSSGQESIRLPKGLSCDWPFHQKTWTGGWASGQWQQVCACACMHAYVVGKSWGNKSEREILCVLSYFLTVYTVCLNRAILAVWTVWNGMNEESKSYIFHLMYN